MRRSPLLAVAVAGALLLPAAAAAKGPSEATITGPGLSSGLTFRGGGEGGDTNLGLLVAQGGFFPQTFGQSPDPTGAKPDDLGLGYSVVYTVPGPSTDTLRQDLYPYAALGPVTYMEPGQKFWGDQSTHGGWYRGSPELKSMLVRAGLPTTSHSIRGRAFVLLRRRR